MDNQTNDDPSPIKVNKLGHLVYEVSDVEKTVGFWTEVMGFTLSDRNHLGMAFLRCGSDHHAIALAQSRSAARPAPATRATASRRCARRWPRRSARRPAAGCRRRAR